MATPVTFVFANEPGASQRQRELNRSKALSHAAQVAHIRKRSSDTRQQVVRHTRAQISDGKSPYGRSKTRESPKGESDEQAEQSTILLRPWKGNSDPFAVWHIQITPEISQILKNYRQFAIPGVYSDLIPKSTLMSWTDGRRETELKDKTQTFDDRAAALSSLHLSMVVMSIHLPTSEAMNRDLRQLRIDAFEAVKSKLDREGIFGPKLLQAFIYLYLAFVLRNEAKSAMIYGRALRQLLDRTIDQYGDHVISDEMALKGAFLDICAGLRFQCHTLLGMERFLRHYFEPVRGLLEPLQPSFRTNLHPFVSADVTLRRLFIQSRECCYLFTQPQLMSIEKGPWNWVFGHAIILQVQIIDHLAILGDQSTPSQTEDHDLAMRQVHTLVSKCLVHALLALFAAKYQNKSEIRYFVPPSELLSRLQRAIEIAQDAIVVIRGETSLAKQLTGLAVRYEEEALLWATFAAALIEIQLLGMEQRVSLDSFQKQRRMFGSISSVGITNILGSFLYLPDFMSWEALEQMSAYRTLPAREMKESP